MSEEDLLKCIVNEKIDSDEITTDEYGILTLDRPNAFELLVTIEAILNLLLLIENGNEVQQKLKRINSIIKTFEFQTSARTIHCTTYVYIFSVASNQKFLCFTVRL